MEASKSNEKLRNARRERGWTQDQLADKLAIGISTVRSWESGTRSPLLIHRSHLSALFEMTPEDLGLVSYQTDQELDLESHEDTEANNNEPQREDLQESLPTLLYSDRSTERYDDENRYRMLNRAITLDLRIS